MTEVPKKKVAAKKKVVAKHPPFLTMIAEAVKKVGKPAKGATRQALVKEIGAQYGKVLSKNWPVLLRLALRRLVASKKLIQTKGSFRPNPALKTKVPKKKKAKKPKKKTTKKKKAKKPKKKSTKKKSKKAGKAKKAKTSAASSKKPKKARKSKGKKKSRKAPKAAAAPAQ